MHMDPALPVLVGIILAVLVMGLLLKAARQPEIIGYLIAGVLIGPHGFAFLADMDVIAGLGSMGVILLLFFIGMEVSPKKIIQGWRIAVLGTLFQVLVSVGVVWAIGQQYDWPVSRIVLLGFVISLSSTAVVLKLLQDRDELKTPVGQDVLMILLAQDLAIVPMLIVIGLLGGESMDKTVIGLQLTGGLVFLLMAAWMVSREMIHLPFARQLRADHELQVFAALLICFGMAFLTAQMHLSTALGAFLGGMLVASAHETDWIKKSLESFRVLFMALFFLSIGMLIDLQFLMQHWVQVGSLVLTVILTNNLINALILRGLRIPWRQCLFAGALLSQIGEFSFVLAAVGQQAEIITVYAYQITVAVIAITLLVSPAWIALVRKVSGFRYQV